MSNNILQQLQYLINQQTMAQQNGGHPEQSALIQQPSAAQLGGNPPLQWVRFPHYPTAPWVSTNPNVGYQTRFYSCGLLSTDGDFSVGTESLRSVQFDIPVRIVAIEGAAFATGGTAITTLDMNLQYLINITHPSGDKLTVFPRLADTVVGRGVMPGEIGGHGYTLDQGGTLSVGITPLRDNIRIDIVFVCMELRPPSNYAMR